MTQQQQRDGRSRGSYLFLALFIALSASFMFFTDEFSFSRRIDVHHSDLVKREVDAEVNQVLLKLGVSKAALLQVQHQGGLTIDNETRDAASDNPVKELLELVEQQKLQIESLKKMADDSKAEVNSTFTVDTTQKKKKVVEDVNSNTGRVFKGEPFQEFTGERVFQSGWEDRIIIANSSSLVRRNPEISTSCTRWGVVTTIFEPTEAVRRVGTMEGWCLVIVADTKTPTNYLKTAGFENETTTIKFLTVEEQQQLAANSTDDDKRMREFVSAIPYRHFARKNLGFLFAIRNGAEFIFDFDDDNIVNLDDATGKPVEIVPEEGTMILKNVSVPLVGPSVFNPYPLMAPSLPDSWPRGLPLQAILDSTTSGTVEHYKDVSMDSIGVIQYLADGNPDIDAVHRLTKDLPMTFQPDSNFMLVPPHTHVPYNAQATIHTKDAFWATLLPFTVPGRVSDIWRSYFAEALFREIGLKVVFGPPRIVQDRNEHNILADMQAELDLYFKAGKLVEFLDGWKPPVAAGNTVPGLMEDLWIALYERGYIGLEDVQLVQLWLSALVESGYKFPKLQRRRHRNVAIMGQFNYPEPINRVLLWHQRWKELFPHIVVRGAWNTTEIQQLNAHGIEAYSHQIAEPKPGFLSPMDNLARTLTQFQDHEEVKAVLYIHDDGLLNMKTLLNGSSVIRTNEIIGTDLKGVGDISYMNPRTIQNSGEKKKYIYKIHRSGIYQNMKGENFTSAKALIGSLKYWDMYNRDHCMPAQRRLAMNFRSDPFRERDGSILFSSYTQGDMLLVPTSVASEFTNVTRLFTKAGVYLECASGTIVDMVRRKTELIKTRVLPLCTTWGGMRGKLGMVHKCRGLQKLGGFVHPVKLGRGLAEWDYAFDMVTFLK